MEKRNIVIGGAWPYANSSLHLGHIAGLISGDVLARFYRLKGDNVMYVSGSDCHGTPITERAKKEGKEPSEIANQYHEKLKELVRKLYDNGYIYEKIEPQAYCEHCNKFLSDREIKLTCPVCKEETKGDQCDNCLHVPTVDELKKGYCIECGNKTIEKDNKNLYIKLSAFQKQIEEHTAKVNHEWRINAQNETNKYLKQGLLDRAVTRDLTWGVDVPVDGYEAKKLYVWIDAVLRLCYRYNESM